MFHTNQFGPFIILQTTVLAIVLQRALLMMTTASSTTKIWADKPCVLIITAQYATEEFDIFTTGATHMAHIHNAILRGYNSIYQQAPHVSDLDKTAFIGYALTWYKFVKSHHDDEEAVLFPRVAEVLGSKEEDIWGETHREHESFLQGLGAYEQYLANLSTPREFDGKKLREIMESFQKPFEHHFHSEVSTVASFSNIASSPSPSSPEETAAATVFKVWGKMTVTKAGTTDVVPFLLMNLDATYEEGIWANWPPMPASVRWGLVNVAGAWNWAWWKFASCDGAGRPRELHALGLDI